MLGVSMLKEMHYTKSKVGIGCRKQKAHIRTQAHSESVYAQQYTKSIQSQTHIKSNHLSLALL